MSRSLWLCIALVACGPARRGDTAKSSNQVASTNDKPVLEIAGEPDDPEPDPEPRPPPPPPPPPDDDNACLITPPSGCQQLAPANVTADANARDAQRASDGSSCTVWNAGGFAPHSVTFDFGVVTSFRAVTLIPEMTPSGAVEHVIELSDDGKRFAVAHRIQAPLSSGVPQTLRLPRTERARFVRVSSKKSPSWIAWREVAFFQCP
jgi:hypothetical protein